MRQAISPDPVIFNDSRQSWANSEGTTLVETLQTLSQAIRDLNKRADAQEKDLRDTQKNLEEAQKALLKYERTFDAHTIEVRSIVLDKWAGVPISNMRRSQRNAAAHGGSILADYDVIRREIDQPESRADRWKPVFESHYNVSWDFLYARGGLVSASKEVVRIFDYLANIRN